LDSLKMVGTLKKGGQLWAVIVSPDGMAHRVSEGNFIGKNFGLVSKITDKEIDIIETFPKGDKWEKRPAQITISERES